MAIRYHAQLFEMMHSQEEHVEDKVNGNVAKEEERCERSP
jgi:hypothetical protein